MAKMILFTGDVFKEVEVADYKEICKLIDCRCFYIATRYINGKYYDIYVDDEGLFTNKPIRGIAIDSKEILVGNMLFSLTDELTGESVSTTKEDFFRIKDWLELRYVEDYSKDLLELTRVLYYQIWE